MEEVAAAAGSGRLPDAEARIAHAGHRSTAAPMNRYRQTSSTPTRPAPRRPAPVRSRTNRTSSFRYVRDATRSQFKYDAGRLRVVTETAPYYTHQHTFDTTGRHERQFLLPGVYHKGAQQTAKFSSFRLSPIRRSNGTTDQPGRPPRPGQGKERSPRCASTR